MCVCVCLWEREREHTQQTEHVRVNSHTNRRCDRLRYAHKGQMEVKGTRTPACQRNMHLAVNQWEMMCARCPSCLICKRLFYANMSWRRSTHRAGEAPRPRCAERGEEEQEINKNGHRITNGAFTQEVCLSSGRVCSPTCPLLLPYTLLLDCVSGWHKGALQTQWKAERLHHTDAVWPAWLPLWCPIAVSLE